MKTVLTIIPCLALWCTVAFSDSWDLKPEIKNTEFIFGNSRIVLHYDSTNYVPIPEYTLLIFKNDKNIAIYKDLGFKQLFASADNKYFLGVSNSGLVKYAYIIFDHEGNILKLQPHNGMEVKYCTESITVIRHWYDSNNPDVKFNTNFWKLRSVSINGCDGNRVSLIK